MKIEQKQLPRGLVELTIELTTQEYEPFLKKAAYEISENIDVQGFRPGKAPYDIIEQRVGKDKIWEHAFEIAVKKTLLKALQEKKLITVGSPKIDVDKLAAGNPVIFKATMSLLPNIELADYSTIKVTKKEVTISDDTVSKSLHDLQKMRGKEVLVYREARKGDKVVIDFTGFIDNVPIEGGEQKKFALVLGDNTFMPDFEKNLIGMKKNDTKEFQVRYPETYHQKNLANKPVDFKAKMLDVYEIQLPALNDEFAISFGKFKNMDEMKKDLQQGLLAEGKAKERQRLDEEIIDALIAKSKIADIPDLLVTSETKKMLNELEQNITSQGMKFDDYLSHMKKTRADLLIDFSPQAVKRIQGALITREVTRKEKIEASKEEVDKEIEKIVQQHPNNEDLQKQTQSTEFEQYVTNILVSRKTMEQLRATMAGE